MSGLEDDRSLDLNIHIELGEPDGGRLLQRRESVG